MLLAKIRTKIRQPSDLNCTKQYKITAISAELLFRESNVWQVHRVRRVQGAPSKNIVQNHLNIALFNVFYYLNGRYRHILSPKIFHLFGFPN